jgi:hypothetical protein
VKHSRMDYRPDDEAMTRRELERLRAAAPARRGPRTVLTEVDELRHEEEPSRTLIFTVPVRTWDELRREADVQELTVEAWLRLVMIGLGALARRERAGGTARMQ